MGSAEARKPKASKYGVKANGKKATGAPSPYDADRHPKAVYYICQHFGATNEEIAKALCVSTATLNHWLKDYPEFLSEYKRGRDEFDSGQVEKALRSRALGYRYTETSTKTVTLMVGPRGEKVATPAEEVTVHDKSMAPDVGAAIFWLTNRQKDRWQQTRYVQHAGKVDGPAAIQNVYQLHAEDVSDISSEDLENLANTITRAAERRRASENRDTGGTPRGTA